jgi:hypothetical protein
MGGYIAVAVVLVILMYFMIVMLKSVVAEANQKVNSYFIKNLEQYDGVYKEQMTNLNKLNIEVEETSRELRNMKQEMVSHKTSPFYAPRPIPRDIYIPTARYIDNDFFEDYKNAKDKLMSIDKQEVIDNVIQKVPYEGDKDRYKIALGILEKIDFEAKYDFVSSTNEQQLLILYEVLNDTEKGILYEYVRDMAEIEDFDILGFIDYVRNIERINTPKVFVSVAENEKDYSNAERKIVCNVDGNICEGLKIVYQNKVYDYSIYKTRRKVGR